MVRPLDTPNCTRKALPPLPPLSPCSPPAPPRPLQAMAVLMPSFLTTPIHVANHGHVHVANQADPRLLAALDLMRRMPPSRMESSLEGAPLHHNQHIYREQHTRCGPTRA